MGQPPQDPYGCSSTVESRYACHISLSTGEDGPASWERDKTLGRRDARRALRLFLLPTHRQAPGVGDPADWTPT
jgi:hypothetical protein